MTSDDATSDTVPNDAVPNDAGATGDDDARSGPGTATRVLLVVATIFALIGSLTTWVNVQLLDTDEWVDLSRELLEDDEIRGALSTRIVEVIYENVAVGEAIDDALPEELQGVGGFIAGAVRDPLTNGIDSVLASDPVQQAWVEANRLVHEQFVAIARDETSDLVSTDDDLSIELRPLVIEVGESLGLPSGLLDRIPEDAGSFVILDQEILDSLQSTARLADLMRWVPVIIAVVLYGLAVYLARRGTRVRAVRGVGWSLTVAGLVVLLIRRLTPSLVVPILVEKPGNEGVAIATIDISTRLLSEVGRTVLWFGVLMILFTVLVGAGQRAAAVRRFIAPAFTGSLIALVGGSVVFVLLMVWWSPARIFEGWFSALWFVVLAVIAVAALRRIEQRESPDRTWADSIGQLRRS